MMEKLDQLVAERNARIAAAPTTPIAKSDPIRDMASLLHPVVQHLMVRAVREYRGAKSFDLAPDSSMGTTQIAPFSAGQYLSVRVKIGDTLTQRPYSISSGPVEAMKNNAYTITVKRAPNGFVSEYILDHWQVGTKVETSDPQGTFRYEMVRDAKDVIAIAGGSGITPFRSMASAIADGYEDFHLTILYGSRTREDILFREDFDAFQAKSVKIRVVHVLSDEQVEGFEHGFIDADLIARYLPKNGPFSVFVCGPAGLYRYASQQLRAFPIPSKYIRYELQGVPKNENAEGKEYTLTVHCRGDRKEIPMKDTETVLCALERAGIKAPSRCRSGKCGFCRSKLLSGEVYIPDTADGRRLADMKFHVIHPCATYPRSDMEIEIYTK